jgi:epoxyqueuosine reductase
MTSENENYIEILHWLRAKAKELGFSDVRISDLDLSQDLPYFHDWLKKGRHGQMHYMSRHANLRANPQELLPGVVRSICFRMDYLPKENSQQPSTDNFRKKELEQLQDPSHATISVYARGRDYHKVLRKNLSTIAKLLEDKLAHLNYRVLVDSAPVLEVALATKSGLGWRGKHTLSLNRDAGSMYFLGEIFVDIPLPIDPPISNHCGTCHDCIDICPTQAIIAPFEIDANRCISYLTIEHPGAIPLELRPLMGNHVYGCDDCQLVCHWNKFAKKSSLSDFDVRNQLDCSSLEQLFAWSQDEFERKMQGSAIYRIGYERWMRNIAVALGNYLRSDVIELSQKTKMVELLSKRIGQISALVDEHIIWALDFEISIK